jgi:hypothetical protein
MADNTYSKAVIKGMALSGWTESQILDIAGLSKAKLKSILEAKGKLTDRQLTSIYDSTGKSGGQLAALTFPKNMASMTWIFDELAKGRPRLCEETRTS